MDKFLIVFPTGESLTYVISKLEQELFNGEYPLYYAIESHIEYHGKSTKGAKVYEMVEGEKMEYVHLTTFNK